MEASLSDQFERARAERLRDGDVLWEANPQRLVGCAYLTGYVAELALAHLVLRELGLARLRATTWRVAYGVVLAKAKRLGVKEEPEGFHNPVFWARLLCKLSERGGDREACRRASKYLRDAKRLRELWSPLLRYEMMDANASSVIEMRTLALRFHRALPRKDHPHARD